ncbi:MAG: hypothetical protein JWQ36_3256 [Enterovirga sp.]|jgi:hypothetical protein|nr:hypothetical protein [Enterovirga sp.]
MGVTDPSLPVAIYLAELPDSAWSDLDALAADVIARFRGITNPEMERGIAISLEIVRAKLAQHQTPKQKRILAALAENGAAGAAALVAAEWATHSGTLRPGSR